MRQEKRIIIEGPDGAGKSSLIQALKSRFHNLVVVRNEKGPDADLLKFWTTELEREEGPWVPVHDRFFYSELVYGPILRGSFQVDKATMFNILWFLRMGSFLIYCRPPLEYIRVGLRTNEQMSGVREKLEEIVSSYDEIMAAEQSFYGGRMFTYDWTDRDSLKELEHTLGWYLISPNSWEKTK